jgi:sec-independent protein translocase protein TatA
MGGLSITHLLVVLIVALLLFGAGRVADVGKGLGEGIRNFKKGLKDDEADPPAKRKVVNDDDDVVEVVKAPKQLAVSAPVTPGKKKKVIQVEVDEDEDEEEIARRIVAKPKTKAAPAAQSEDEKAT